MSQDGVWLLASPKLLFPLQGRAQHRYLQLPRQMPSVYQNNTLFEGTSQAVRDGKGASGDVYTNLVVFRARVAVALFLPDGLPPFLQGCTNCCLNCVYL